MVGCNNRGKAAGALERAQRKCNSRADKRVRNRSARPRRHPRRPRRPRRRRCSLRKPIVKRKLSHV